MRLQSAESPGSLTRSGADVGGVFCEGEQREGQDIALTIC